MTDWDILIIGGGICGLTTAIALEQQGLKPTVYEAADCYRPVGAGILLQTNALSVLSEFGLADSVAASGATIHDIPIRSPDGSTLLRFDLDYERNQFGHGFVAIHRAVLQEHLLDELDASVRTGMECVSVDDPSTPIVEFTDGSTVEGDLVIGADGIQSTVRETVQPEATVRPFDCVAYRGVTAAPDQSKPAGFEVWGPGSFVGCSPLGDGRVYWYATATESLAPNGTVAATKTALQDRFGEYPEPIPQLIESTAADEVITTPLADVAPLDSWSTGSVVLAGDAAHGMLPFVGQGAAQAIEDAAVLATALVDHDDPAAGFEAYEQCRKPRAEKMVAASRRLGRFATIDSSTGWRLRNLFAWLLPSKLSRRLRAKQAVASQYPQS